MSTRSYSSFLLFENAFDYMPTGNPDFCSLANSIFKPDLPIVETDCGTTLGRFETVNFEAEGLTELATDQVVTRPRIEQLLSQGIYEFATRHTSACVSEGGVCAKCYHATYPDRPIPKYLDRVVVYPEFLVGAEVLGIQQGIALYPFTTDTTTFDKVNVFQNGILLTQGIDYTLSGNVLVFSQTPTQDGTAVMRFLQNTSTSPFMAWLGNTFSGSMLGMQSLPSQALPVRSLLLSSLISENRLQLLNEYLEKMEVIPSDYSDYCTRIRDPLERALLILALYCIYSNVTS